MNLNTGGWASPLLRLVARLRSEGINSTTPVTEINGGTISAPNADIALVAKGTGATLAQVPDGTTAGGNKRGLQATDLQKIRTSASGVASGAYSAICGGYNNQASNSYSAVLGGASNVVSGGYAVIAGGISNTASGDQSCLAGGFVNSATGTRSTIGGGSSNTANSINSCIPGGAYGNTRGIEGYFAFPACNSPIAFSTGVTQSGLLLLGRELTDNVGQALTSNTSAPSTTNQVILPDNSAYSFSGEVIAGVTNGGDTARWTINGAIKRGFGASTTVLVGTPTVTKTHNDAGAAGWGVVVTADLSNGGIRVTVTGAASTTIRWVAKINTTEMTF